jgi:glutamate-5-semialdehyde dehydrogenase
MNLHELVKDIKSLVPTLGALSTETKNQALESIAQILIREEKLISEANQLDLEAAEKEAVDKPLVARLNFQGKKMTQAIDGLRSLQGLPDPVGRVLSARELDEGLILQQESAPIGVIGMIFESRPDALVQIAALALKSGNGLVLKGGSEAKHTNRILADLIEVATKEAGIPEGWIYLLETREEVTEILAMHHEIDLLIPRGSNAFVQYIMNNTQIPVLGHADGITHLYIDEFADLEMAVKVAIDSKTQYVSVCNALETLLVHQSVAEQFLPEFAQKAKAKDVKLIGCAKTAGIIDVQAATEEDWKTEYLDYILSIKIVGSMAEAITHINTYGSGHTDSIVTAKAENAEAFMNLVDAGCVFWNTSTRFSDGFVFGLGAEVGVSTQKIHARGPVGLEGLQIYKWKLRGQGHVMETYKGDKPKPFTHKELDPQ